MTRVGELFRDPRALLGKTYVWVALAALVILFCAISPSFRTVANFQNVLMQNGIIGIVAMGMLVMMVSGGFDLSVGAVGGAVAVLIAFLSQLYGTWIAVIAGLILGIVLGTVNGLIIARMRINSFITTFAISTIVLGVLFVITNGKSVPGRSAELQAFSYGAVLGISNIFLAFIVFALITWLLLTRTKFGHWTFSTGANEYASYLSGIPTVAVRAVAFVFGGFSVAVAATLMFGQSSIGQPTGAETWPLNSIAICVIGGVSLAGGVGRVSNVVAATLLLGVVSNGLNQLGVSPYWQPAVTGAIILGAVILDRLGTPDGPSH